MKILLKRGFFLFFFFTLLLFTRCECPKRDVVPKRVNVPKKTLQQTYHEKVKEKELGTEGKLTYEEKEKLVDKAYEESKEWLEQSYKQEEQQLQHVLSQVENGYKNLNSDLSSQDICNKELELKKILKKALDTLLNVYVDDNGQNLKQKQKSIEHLKQKQNETKNLKEKQKQGQNLNQKQDRLKKLKEQQNQQRVDNLSGLKKVIQELKLIVGLDESQDQPHLIQKLEELLQAMKQKHQQDSEQKNKQIQHLVQDLKQNLNQNLENLGEIYQKDLKQLEQERDRIKQELKEPKADLIDFV